MRTLQELLQIKTSSASNIRSERASIVQDFVERLNKEREGTQYKPLSPRSVAVKMAHLSLEDLYWFYKNCDNASCGFSRAWWGSLKRK